MGLQDALRKAASLVLEMPDAPPASQASHTSDAEIDAILAGGELDPPRRAATSEAVAGRAATGATGATGARGTKTVEQIVREADGPNLDEIKVSEVGLDKQAGVLKPSDIYAAVKLPASPFSAEQMLDMLASLPPELPLETRRATIKVTLGALGKGMGATPETIVADASRKIAALSAYNDHLAKRTAEFVAREEATIQDLQKQIEDKRQAILDAKNTQAQAMQSSKTESERLDDVLEFFSLDIAPSKHAPPTPPTPR
jgi:vacuolar-type H+-ATPase subunit H